MRSRILLAVACVCSAVIGGASLGAQALDPIRYTLRFPAPHTHYVEVEAAIPTAGRAEVEVYMATWTPGSYLIREYERNVEAVNASAGARPLAVAKSTKNRWKITTGGAPNITLRYKVYSREMTVRNNWVESGVRDAERRADVHHARRARGAAARSPHRAAAGLEEGRDGARTRQRIAEYLPRPRLRHHRRQPDHHRQSRDARVHRRRQAARRVFEGDTAHDRRRQGGRRRAEDRRRREERDGVVAVSALSLPQHGHRIGRRARAQEQLSRHDQSLRDPDATRAYKGFLGHARARVLSQLEREASSAG